MPAFTDYENALTKLFSETLQKLCVYLGSDERVQNLMNYAGEPAYRLLPSFILENWKKIS